MRWSWSLSICEANIESNYKLAKAYGTNQILLNQEGLLGRWGRPNDYLFTWKLYASLVRFYYRLGEVRKGQDYYYVIFEQSLKLFFEGLDNAFCYMRKLRLKKFQLRSFSNGFFILKCDQIPSVSLQNSMIIMTLLFGHYSSSSLRANLRKLPFLFGYGLFLSFFFLMLR